MEQLRALAAGTATIRECPELRKHTLPLKFMPVSERDIERAHAIIHQVLQGKRKRYAVTVSLSNRLPEIADRIEEEPDFLNKLATAMTHVSHARAIATSFRLAAIPHLQQCLQTMHHTLARKHLVRFMYHIH